MMFSNAQLIGGAVVAGVLIYTANQKAKAALNTVNPLNNDNVIAGFYDNVGGAVTGKKNFKLGSFLYDLTHRQIYDNVVYE